MSVDLSKCLIVNAAWGSWYPRGQARLKESLVKHNYRGDTLFFCNEQINELFDPKYPYTIKAAAISEAVKLNYDYILWLDCSIYCVREINSFFDIIHKNDCYIVGTSKNLAQTSADSDLEWAGISRDDAENLRELASTLFGFNMKKEKWKTFYSLFIDGVKNGVCNTSRYHDGQSIDKRFLYARQDQTLISHCFHRVGFNSIFEQNQYSGYWFEDKKCNESVYFLINGL